MEYGKHMHWRQWLAHGLAYCTPVLDCQRSTCVILSCSDATYLTRFRMSSVHKHRMLMLQLGGGQAILSLQFRHWPQHLKGVVQTQRTGLKHSNQKIATASCGDTFLNRREVVEWIAWKCAVDGFILHEYLNDKIMGSSFQSFLYSQTRRYTFSWSFLLKQLKISFMHVETKFFIYNASAIGTIVGPHLEANCQSQLVNLSTDPGQGSYAFQTCCPCLNELMK